MIDTGGKEYYKLIGYFMGRTMEALENTFGEISSELEEVILDCGDLAQMSEIYNISKRSKDIKSFEESMRILYE